MNRAFPSRRLSKAISSARAEPVQISDPTTLLAIGAAISISFLCKMVLALTTFGTNDVASWDRFRTQILRDGGFALYGNPDIYVLVQQSAQSLFNHPPFMIHVLRVLDLLGHIISRLFPYKAYLAFPFSIRLPGILADIGSAILVWKIMSAKPSKHFKPVCVACMVLAPVSVMISGFHGNTDGLLMFFLLLSIYLIDVRPSLGLAGLSLGMSLSIKIVPIIFIPCIFCYLGSSERRLRFFGAAAVMWLAGSLPYLAQDPGLILARILGYGGDYGVWGLSRLLGLLQTLVPKAGFLNDLYASVGQFVVLGVILILSIWVNQASPSKPSLFMQCGLVCFAFLSVTPGFGLQYLLWLVPWVVALGLEPSLVFYAASGAFSFFVYTLWSRGFPWYFADSWAVGVWLPLQPRAYLFGLEFSLFFLELLCWFSVVRTLRLFVKACWRSPELERITANPKVDWLAGRKMRQWLVPGTAMFLAIVAHLNLLSNGFVYDDYQQIVNNAWLRDPRHISDIWNSNVWAFQGMPSNYYRPLMHLLNMALFHVFGLRAWGYHLAGVIFHAACTLLVWTISREIGLGERTAFWAAVLFSVHPIHTEAIAWISANNELVCTCLVLLVFLLYLRGRPWWSVAAFLPALLMKETGVVALLLIAAWKFQELRELTWGLRLRKIAITIAPYLAPVAVYLGLRVHALHGLMMGSNSLVLALDTRVYSIFFLVGRYMLKLVAPLPFNVFHVFHPVTTPWDWRFVGGLAATAVAVAGGYVLWRRGSRRWLAVFLFFAALAPVLWIQRVADNVFTERYLYIPSIGFCWLLGTLLAWDPPSTLRGRAAVTCGVLLAVLGGLVTVNRNRDFHDDMTLWRKSLSVDPDSIAARHNLASTCLREGLLPCALENYPPVVQAKPFTVDILIGYASALSAAGRLPEARVYFERARALEPGRAASWYNLGVLADREGHPAEAERNYRRALELDSHYASAHENLAVLLVEQKKLGEAEAHFDAAGAFLNLGKLLAMEGKFGQAERAYRLAIQEEKHTAEALSALGSLLNRLGRRQEADELLRKIPRRPPASTVTTR